MTRGVRDFDSWCLDDLGWVRGAGKKYIYIYREPKSSQYHELIEFLEFR